MEKYNWFQEYLIFRLRSIEFDNSFTYIYRAGDRF